MNGFVKISDSHETQEECLGLAVLDMTRTAKEKQMSPLDIYHTTRYYKIGAIFICVACLNCCIGSRLNQQHAKIMFY